MTPIELAHRRFRDPKLHWVWRRILRSQRSRWPRGDLTTREPFDPTYDLR